MKKSVLAVDDSRTVLNMVELYLKNDYEIILATSGNQAFQILQKRMVDIILLDINMPVMNGLVVLKKLREIEEYQEIPVLFLTGDAHRATVVESFQTGSQGYILKPVKKEELIKRMEEIMQKQKDRLEKKAEEEKKRQEEEEKKKIQKEEERKRKEEEQKENEKKEVERKEAEKKETEKKEENLLDNIEESKKEEKDLGILVKPVEEQEDLSYDPFEDLGDILENFVKEDEDTE